MKNIFCFLFLLCSFHGFACLNLYAINESGRESHQEFQPPHRIHFNEKYELENLRKSEGYIKTSAPEDKHRNISNYAVYLVKLGRSKEALPIFRKLAAEHPDEYEILANLATAYELNGEPDSALLYMKQSLKLNPDSHNGSEWFHLRFLEAAIKVRDEKLSPADVNVLGLEKPTDNTAEEIAHQLRERVPLSSSPNPLLAKALEESADHFRTEVSIDWAMKLYAMSIGYATDEKQIQRIWRKIESGRARILELNKLNSTAEKRVDGRKEMLKKDCRNYVNKDISKWRAHKSHYEANLDVLKF